MSDQYPEMNEIKVIWRIRPRVFYIINSKFRIRSDPNRLYWAQIDSLNQSTRILVRHYSHQHFTSALHIRTPNISLTIQSPNPRPSSKTIFSQPQLNSNKAAFGKLKFCSLTRQYSAGSPQ